METISKLILPSILLLLTLVFGLWLSLSGKPYNGLLFNFHKLIALGMVVLAAINFYQILKNTTPQTFVTAMLVLAGVCIVTLFDTGAMMSIGTPNYFLVLTIHRVMIVLLVIAMIGSVTMLEGAIKI